MLKIPHSKRIITDQEETILTGLDSSSLAYVLSQHSDSLPPFSLIISKNISTASALLSDLRFFLSSIEIKKKKPTVILFPGWDLSPYSKLSSSVGNRVQRLSCLKKIQEFDKNSSKEILIIVSPIAALAQGTIAPEILGLLSLNLELNKEFSVDKICAQLDELNYSKIDVVEDPGTYSSRGGVMDIFCPTQKRPYRIDFFGNEIENISIFNVETQKRIKDVSLKKISISPLHEIDTSYIAIERARNTIRNWADKHSYSRSSRENINRVLTNKIINPEMNYLLPFFNSKRSFLWDYLKKDKAITIYMEEKDIESDFLKFLNEKEKEFEISLKKEVIVPSPEELYSNYSQLREGLKGFKSISCSYLNIDSQKKTIKFRQEKLPSLLISKDKKSPNIKPLLDFLHSILSENNIVFFVASTQSQLDRIYFLLSQNNIDSQSLNDAKDGFPEKKVVLVKGLLQKSFFLMGERVIFLSEQDIFGTKKANFHKTMSPQKSFRETLNNTAIGELEKEDFIIHIEHGIGIYKGLKRLKVNHILGDYVHLEYAGKDRLYLPVYRLEFIQKYVGVPGKQPGIDKLGSNLFNKIKAKAKRAIKDIAVSLLKIYAKRKSHKSFVCAEPDNKYREFELNFPYEETPDQVRAIEDTIDDMCSEQSMDRLICGDVGYGKTEVAMRAAFHAVNNGKQVAMLVPTTILSIQHLERFRERFKDFPIIIESLTRFHGSKRQKEIISDLSENKIDIIIGTHRLLSKDVKTANLGLLIIDEEQRFGVTHKEKLKKLRANTNVLTLTATPIPRTLYLSLMGIRDMSIIQTAPVDRFAIRTFIVEFDEDIIRGAIQQEINRGGQAFFIHNRVDSIPTVYRMLVKLCPDIKIAVAHGQLPAKALEKVMMDFYERKYDLLICTTIIENGLDIPSTNTILVNQAHHFGLSQLYQIRGRVGRSHVKAFAYFILPKNVPIGREAKERLNVLERHVELGSGFAVASHDLEIRGGGDILGEAQSGHLTAIGYDLYMELLEEEIASLRGQEVAPQEEIEIRTPFSAYIPEDYIQSPKERLITYKKFSNYKTEEEVEEGQEELVDRFGKVPQETIDFLYLVKIKILLRQMGFRSLVLTEKKCSLEVGEGSQVDVEKLLALLQKEPKSFKMGKGGKKFVFYRATDSMEEGCNAMQYLYQKLSPFPLPHSSHGSST